MRLCAMSDRSSTRSAFWLGYTQPPAVRTTKTRLVESSESGHRPPFRRQLGFRCRQSRSSKRIGKVIIFSHRKSHQSMEGFQGVSRLLEGYAIQSAMLLKVDYVRKHQAVVFRCVQGRLRGSNQLVNS
ncbi:hypothetical protein HBH98_085700 [Parastagonospora nodorum]|nr:hypothetical protein HBH98_085700 [Parastagonospora nodorum]KAH4407533.1 hypothetical protein HBH99_078920 [Parastagonospora nodorum]KAH5447258.1 hypothetical protein HBI31_251430 [Parastagonospora nodorum]KAH6218209.1 hypothetical protein HBI43_112000 [Parastagonospora nodorum]KAH6260937.1 hypothetical protein HBI41_131690 [Parastagonospora nodorum]